MDEHAPGPWSIQPYVDGIDILDADGEVIAHLADRTIAYRGMPPENARLIAAAPELLKACKGMLKHIDEILDDDDLMHRRAALRAAIRLATGGDS